MVVDVLVAVTVGFTGDFVMTLVCMLGKFNESKNGVRDDIMDNSFDSIGFRLAFGPCREDALVPKLLLITVFDDDVALLAVVVVVGAPKSKLFCCKYE